LKLLLLGGTTEASVLARRLAGDRRFTPILSYAGRTRQPAPPPIPWRVGGFGGVDGLAHFLATESIEALIDATHPFATRMSAHAVQAARRTEIPLLAVQRPPWVATPDDHWTEVPTMAHAAAALGPIPQRVFLTVGQQELFSFSVTPHHYVVRSVDPPPFDLLPGAVIIAARGPFQLDDEIDLLRTHRIDRLVTKNSGGTATAAKLEAARACHVPVIMVARPASPTPNTVADADAVWGWLEHLYASRRGA